MFLSIVLLVVSLLLILLAAVLFTNAIELLGERLNLHAGAVGSILAAVGTALPETVIPVIAILVAGQPEDKEVGIGAIAGAPFMLGTLAMFVTGAAVMIYAALGRRKRSMHIDHRSLARDLTFFVLIYGAAVLATFVHDFMVLKVAIAIGLMLSYVWYIKMTLAGESHAMENSDALMLTRITSLPSTTFWIAAQIFGALALMIFSAHLFIEHVKMVAVDIGIPALILSMIITPIATELPEKFNSVIWISRKKDVLALGNITGAMVFQSSFPVVFGILFTNWDLRGPTMVSAILAFASALLILAYVKITKTMSPYVLMVGVVFYAAFFAYILLR